MNAFDFAPPPRIIAGPGRCMETPALLRVYGTKVLLISGRSACEQTAWNPLMDRMKKTGLECFHETVHGEPSPETVDAIVASYHGRGIGAIFAWGGGSVIDAAKAVAAMLPGGEPVSEFLEGVGSRKPDGRTLPLIVMPTTAGTGSEATKNAVISRIGPEGFKKSLRHDNYIPAAAVLDPELSLSCPPDVTAACGMDAFTQLLEGFVSVKASPMTDALALSGLAYAGRCLRGAVERGGTDLEARAGMLYAALQSGIVLANAGLGLVHGLASPIGARFPAPHGVVCGTLTGAVTEAVIARLREEGEAGEDALDKYARAARAVTGEALPDTEAACDRLLGALLRWAEDFGIGRLGAYGMTAEDVESIAREGDNKNSPAPLDQAEIARLLQSRL
jgi:alcohol dehydrogenase